MDIRVRKIYEALFALEELRELYRHTVPAGLDEQEEAHVSARIAHLEQLIQELKAGNGIPIKQVTPDLELRTREEEYININPIQAGGRLTVDARKALIAYGDGYSVCDRCLTGRLDEITQPPIAEFHAELAEFVGMDEVRVLPGARRGFQAVTSSLVARGDVVIVSDLAHYTEFLAVELAGGVIREATSGEEHVITGEAVAEAIDVVKSETGKLPKLIIIELVDYSYGNVHDVAGVGTVAQDYGIPFLCNGAYAVGMMPVNGKEIGADFLVGSGHKGMAAVAPSGILATTAAWSSRVFRGSGIMGDRTGRRFEHKEPELLGCTLMGATVLSMMASFPAVKERVQHWDDEVAKSNYFAREFLRIDGNRIMSEYPRRHTLSRVDTRASFDQIAKTHKRRGYFLSEDLKKRKIVGEFAGSTRVWKLNTYGLSWARVKYLSAAFLEIAENYGLKIH
ncbi:MAG TPA: O-phospho-L-seryl-tRNA:Cys-tRNA synthase [Methanomicrobia archaeon]|nr:O-phospho-L-seryl-tRNA:Cys-tRNA synthase [Methanomicrobia archaeon]